MCMYVCSYWYEAMFWSLPTLNHQLCVGCLSVRRWCSAASCSGTATLLTAQKLPWKVKGIFFAWIGNFVRLLSTLPIAQSWLILLCYFSPFTFNAFIPAHILYKYAYIYVIYTYVFKERRQNYECTCAWLMCGFKVLWELPVEQWYEAIFYIIWFCMHDVSAIAFSIITYVHT